MVIACGSEVIAHHEHGYNLGELKSILGAGMLAVFAEFEHEILRERVKAGIAQARAKGTNFW